MTYEFHFEKKVFSGLEACGILPDSVSLSSPLGAAVSGGADSVSLLLALTAIFGGEKLRVITVNHGIRSEEESGGDALFVKKLCDSLKVSCKIISIGHGKILETAKTEKKSVEEVARTLRYEAFNAFIREENLVSLCLAHNQGDNLETVLMRFLQGSAGEGMSGIARVREKICRPLLDISRAEIESYLHEKKQDWRTDATNSDVKYLRNKVRNILIPVLNENFSGWQRAVLSGARKNACDEDFLQGLALKEVYSASENSRSILLPRSYFYSLHDALKRRVFFDTLNKTGFGSRFPYRLFEEVASWKDESSRGLCYERVRISLDSENLCILISDDKKNLSGDEDSIESGFMFLLKAYGNSIKVGDVTVKAGLFSESESAVENPYGSIDGAALLTVSYEAEKLEFPVRLPCLVRSSVSGDKIKTADGNYKSLSEIFSDWKIPEKQRDKIIVVEDSEIRAVIASPFGFSNWIVDFHKL